MIIKLKIFFLKHNKNKLTTILFNVSVNSTRGLDGGALQFALSTSPGSYLSRSVHNDGRFSGSSAMKNNKKKLKN